MNTVYPCTYRELFVKINLSQNPVGISLYLQGTPIFSSFAKEGFAVYPCTYRELRRLLA